MHHWATPGECLENTLARSRTSRALRDCAACAALCVGARGRERLAGLVRCFCSLSVIGCASNFVALGPGALGPRAASQYAPPRTRALSVIEIVLPRQSRMSRLEPSTKNSRAQGFEAFFTHPFENVWQCLVLEHCMSRAALVTKSRAVTAACFCAKDWFRPRLRPQHHAPSCHQRWKCSQP